jgi:phosphohistidine phosphatase
MSTYLYLVQHGEAKSKEEDPERPLNNTGIANAQKAGNFLKQQRKEISTIIHSGKKRAEQTARIIADTMGQTIRFEKGENLAPMDDISIIKREIEKTEHESMMIVGHMPHLSRLASGLLTENKDRGVIRFRNAGIVCLSNEYRTWQLEWMVTPEIIS